MAIFVTIKKEKNRYVAYDLLCDKKVIQAKRLRTIREKFWIVRDTYCISDNPFYYGISKDIVEYLPHGFGIDGSWKIEKKGKNLICYNSYHIMNEVGFYDEWIDFKVIIPINSPASFKLVFPNKKIKNEYIHIYWEIEDKLSICLNI